MNTLTELTTNGGKERLRKIVKYLRFRCSDLNPYTRLANIVPRPYVSIMLRPTVVPKWV